MFDNVSSQGRLKRVGVSPAKTQFAFTMLHWIVSKNLLIPIRQINE